MGLNMELLRDTYIKRRLYVSNIFVDKMLGGAFSSKRRYLIPLIQDWQTYEQF